MWGRDIIEVKYSSYDLNPKFVGCHQKADTEEDRKPEIGAFPGLLCWCEVQTAERRDACLEAKETVVSGDAAARLRRERAETAETSSGAELEWGRGRQRSLHFLKAFCFRNIQKNWVVPVAKEKSIAEPWAGGCLRESVEVFFCLLQVFWVHASWPVL